MIEKHCAKMARLKDESGAYAILGDKHMSAQLFTLCTVRHGESAGNVARDRTLSAGSRTIDLTERDLDGPLSALGLVH